jgi:hypothetical protein
MPEGLHVMRREWRNYLLDLLKYSVVVVLLGVVAVSLSMFLDEVFEGEAPYLLRLAFAVIFLLVLVILFAVMTGKSYLSLQRSKERGRS